MMPAVLVSCEHGGNRIPARWAPLFAGRTRLLASHRGFDAGARELARRLARRLEADLVTADVSRLLVDLNRSPHHPRLFSEITRGLPAAERERILERCYRPYRQRVESWVALRLARRQPVLHLSVHSFTPVLRGETRDVDLGLLYVPSRRREVAVCRALRSELARRDPDLRVRANQPYRGTADGLATFLRRRFPAARYVAVELEINQRWVRQGGAVWRRLQEIVAGSLALAIGRPPSA